MRSRNSSGGVALALGALLAVSAAPIVAQAAGIGFTWSFTSSTTTTGQGETNLTKSRGTLTVTDGSGESISVTDGKLILSDGTIVVSGAAASSTAAVNGAGSIEVHSGTIIANSLIASVTGTNGNAYIQILGGIVDAGSLTVEGKYHTDDYPTELVVNGDAVLFVDQAPSVTLNNSPKNPDYTRGVVFIGNAGKVYGSVELPGDIEIPEGYILTVPSGASLTIPAGTTLTNNGTIIVEQGGTFTNNGTLDDYGTINGSVTGTQPVDRHYSINFEAETITIAEGYSLYAEQTGGDAILTSTAGNNTTSLTGYIQGTARTLYLQAPATGGAEQPGRREITIPARPQAPTVYSISIDYSEEELAFSPGVTATTLEYATETNLEWKDVPSGAALAEMEWDGSAEKTYFFRTGATDTSFASSQASATITAPARPAKPADPETVEVTSDSITIEVVSGQEYRLGPSGSWSTPTGTTGSDGKTVYTYANLTSGTSYTIETRTPADDNVKFQFASHPASIIVTTKSSAASAPEVGTATVTDTTVTLPYDATWEYQLGDGDWRGGEGSNVFTGLTPATRHTFYVRVAETEVAEASQVATVTAWTAFATPEGVRGGINRIDGVSADMEYSADGGKTWVACDGASVTGLPAGEYLVRRKGAGDIPASPAVTVTATRYVSPAPSGPDWDDVVDEIEAADDGDTVVVDMGDETELPDEVLEVLAGRDVTVVVEMGDGVSWEINGGDVPEGTHFPDIDLGVGLGTSGIPVSVTNLVTGEAGVVQVTLAHEGPFGFELTLVAPLGAKNEGLVANLYHYNEDAGALRYECSGTVGEDGTARLRLDHASQWAIALDTRSHALPFADAAEGEWYSEPVRWAWLRGVMCGYADGSEAFGTEDALTRAQMAAVLQRLSGGADGDVSILPADCSAHAWYAGSVAWALETGVFEGYGDGSAFGPADQLTREQAAVVLMRWSALMGEDVSARADLSGYPDADHVSPWASDALSWAVAEGVLSGAELEGGARGLQPLRACTRAEMAALLMRLSTRA